MCSTPFQRDRCNHNKSLKLNCQEFYCSKACSQQHHALKHRKLCAHCQAPVLAAGRCRNAKYCSKECWRAACPLPEVACPQCGVVYAPSSARNTYCSKDCADVAHSVRMVGTGNSHYKDGRSYALWFQEMRPLIMERDQGCVVCRKQGSPHIHHVDHDPANNLPENLVQICHGHHIAHHKSDTTPWPWFAAYAQARSQFMTSKWKALTISLRERFASTTV